MAKLNFLMVICNIDDGSINFIHEGKLSFFDRIGYNSTKFGDNPPRYAFRPKNTEQFLEFVKNTSLGFPKEFTKPDFYISCLSVQNDTSNCISFDWLVEYFLRTQKDLSQDIEEAFKKDCENIRNAKRFIFNTLEQCENES